MMSDMTSRMTFLVDTHCHLGADAFDGDRDAVIARARAAGVACAIIVGQNPAENLRVLSLCRDEPFLRPAVGQHPDQPDEAAAEESLRIARANLSDLAAIGEVGLDHRVVEDPDVRRTQLRIFQRFIELAVECGLALTVHSRSAGHYAIDALIDGGAPRAVLHAFDGKAKYALRGCEAGFGYSIPPSIVRSEQKRRLVDALPLDALLLESDAPALGPTHDARNEPANVVVALDAVAAIKAVERDEVAAATTANARRFFRLDGAA